MDALKLWCRIICITVIASGVLLSVLPETRLKKSYRAFVSLLVVFVLISPFSRFKDIGKLIDDLSYKSEFSQENLILDNSQVVINCAEELLEERLNEILYESDIEGYCKSCIKENESGAYIEKIEVYGEFTSEQTDKIIIMLTEATGGDTKIEFIG